MADLHVSSMNGLVGRLPFMGMKLLEEGGVWVEGQELSMGPPNFKVLYEPGGMGIGEALPQLSGEAWANVLCWGLCSLGGFMPLSTET